MAKIIGGTTSTPMKMVTDDALDINSNNPVQNKAVTSFLNDAFYLLGSTNLLNPAEVEKLPGSDPDDMWYDGTKSFRTGFIPAEPDDWFKAAYEHNGITYSANIYSVRYYDAKQTELGHVSGTNGDAHIPKYETNVAYVRFEYSIPGDVVGNVWVNKGTTILPYEPYFSKAGTLRPECLPEGVDLGGNTIIGLSVTDDGNGNVTVEGGEDIPAVLFVNQNLTEEQKAQARENIGAGTGSGASITVDDKLDPTSTNPVQNKILTPIISEVGGQAYQAYTGLSQLRGSVTALENQVGYIETAIADMQPVRFTVTKNGNTYVSSKTRQELLDILAENEHRSIICEIEGIDVPLLKVATYDALVFSTTITIWSSILVQISDVGGEDMVTVYKENHSLEINGQVWDEDDPNADFTDTINEMIDDKIGNIDTALSNIIAIQENLIGGGSV